MNPYCSGRIFFGATFDREHLDTRTTEEGKIALFDAMTRLSPALIHSTLIDHQANIRPGTLDRRPFIGRHPEHGQIAIFNGFGAKGTLQIPWYSRHFADALLSETPLLASCDLRRYFEKYGST